jgi:hypothetical protein
LDPVTLDIVIQPEENVQVGVTEAPFSVSVEAFPEIISTAIINSPMMAEISPETFMSLSETIEVNSFVSIMEAPQTQTTIINVGPKGDPGSGGGGSGGFDPAQAAYAIALRG